MSYDEHKSLISDVSHYPERIKVAREQAGIQMSQTEYIYKNDEIPFNLEREYFDLLIDEGKLTEARLVLERMKKSYKPVWENLIEGYEYRMHLVEKTNELIREKLIKAEKEFNHHTILIISITVGVVTIFSTATETLTASNLKEGLISFGAICSALIFLVVVVTCFNKR